MIRHLDLYILLFLNKSNLIFISSQFQISALNKQESQSSPRFLVTLFASALCDFSPTYWIKGILKSDKLTMKSFTLFPEIHLRFMAAHLQISWCRNIGQEIKLYFPLSDFSGVQFPFFHTVFPHTICFSDRRL